MPASSSIVTLLPAGVSNVTLTASNISGTDTQTLVITIASNQGPAFLSLDSDQNPALINQTVNFTFSASDADTQTLNYSLDYGDGSAISTGTFPQGTFVALPHAYTTYTAGATVTLTVTDGFNAITQTLIQQVPMPASGGSGIPNTVQNDPPIVTPPTVPGGGLGVSVMASDGGVIQLHIDESQLTFARSAYNLSTDWGDISGRSSKGIGANPVHQYINRGIFVATITAAMKGTGKVIGKGRITLPISSKETGDMVPNPPSAKAGIRPLDDANDTGIATKSIRGKFSFGYKMPDLVTYTGTIKAPPGLTIGEPHEFWIAIGNIVVKTNIDKNGKGQVPGDPPILKSLKVVIKGKKGTVTQGGEPTTVTVMYSTTAMTKNGYDTEGISAQSTDVSKGKTATRNIQVAMLLDGAPFQSLAPVDFGMTNGADFGTISGRSGK